MPALLGYLVAVSMLLGGAYAGLQWLSGPDAVRSEKTAAHSRNAPDRSPSTRLGSNAADRKTKADNPGKVASAEAADETSREANHADPDTIGQSSKLEKVEGGGQVRGCSPIGLTSNGDLVFSMQCQEMIERHRRELDSSQTANQADRSTKPDLGKDDGTKDRAKDVAAQPPDHAADQASNDAAATGGIRPGNRSNPETEHQISRREPVDSRAAPHSDSRADETLQGSGPSAESRSSGPKPDRKTNTPPNSAKQKQMARTKPQTISRTTENHDVSEQRSPPPSRSRRMAARGDSDLWYNVLGLR
jgi:hypothetical protein